MEPLPPSARFLKTTLPKHSECNRHPLVGHFSDTRHSTNKASNSKRIAQDRSTGSVDDKRGPWGQCTMCPAPSGPVRPAQNSACHTRTRTEINRAELPATRSNATNSPSQQRRNEAQDKNGLRWHLTATAAVLRDSAVQFPDRGSIPRGKFTRQA